MSVLRRTVLHLLALFFILPLFSSAAEKNLSIIRVLTYNIHHGEGSYSKLDVERIGRIMKSAQADLVALQEVDNKAKRTGGVDQAAKLAEFTGLHAAFGPAMEFQGGSYGVAILSRWPLHEVETHPLPASPDTEPRVLQSALVAVHGSSTKVRFLVTHLDHRSDPAQRKIQAAKIRELVAPKPGEPAAILAGDFNAAPGSEEIGAFLRESWSDSAAGMSFPTFPSESPKTKIDYIFIRPATTWRVIETLALDEPVASDHRPVLAVLELR